MKMTINMELHSMEEAHDFFAILASMRDVRAPVMSQCVVVSEGDEETWVSEHTSEHTSEHAATTEPRQAKRTRRTKAEMAAARAQEAAGTPEHVAQDAQIEPTVPSEAVGLLTPSDEPEAAETPAQDAVAPAQDVVAPDVDLLTYVRAAMEYQDRHGLPAAEALRAKAGIAGSAFEATQAQRNAHYLMIQRGVA